MVEKPAVNPKCGGHMDSVWSVAVGNRHDHNLRVCVGAMLFVWLWCGGNERFAYSIEISYFSTWIKLIIRNSYPFVVCCDISIK